MTLPVPKIQPGPREILAGRPIDKAVGPIFAEASDIGIKE